MHPYNVLEIKMRKITQSALAMISAIFGLFNPKFIEWIRWYSGNPVPFGHSPGIMDSAGYALISSVTGTIALFMIQKAGSDSKFKYAALVGSGLSYPFILYYIMATIGLFGSLLKVK